jgi:HPt (histidine-containing phosphotransfer) domain-containing protein
VTNEEKDLIQVTEALKRLPHFDSAAFIQLIEDTGPVVAMRILARFEVGAQESLAAIQKGIAQENSDSIWQACHKLTGSAELIGFKEFGAKSRRLNRDMKALPDIQTHLEELTHYLRDGEALLAHIQESFPQFKDYL